MKRALRVDAMQLRFTGLRLRTAVLASLFLAACSGTVASPSLTTTPQPSPTLDAAGLVSTYVTVLSRDLGQLQPIDSSCGGATQACRTALDQAAVVAGKAGDDLQRTPAEPDVIRQPVEDIRDAARLILALDRAFAAGTMPLSEAANAYMAEYNAIEQALRELQASRS